MIISNIELTINSLSKLIKLSWNKWVGEFSSYAIIKKRNSIPKNIKDGNLIYRGKEPYYEDTDVKNGEIYYYRLFIILTDDLYGDIVTDNKCVGKAIGFTNEIDYGSSLYNQVPEAVRYQDDKLKKDLPLKRFFQLISFPFDKLDMLVENQLKQLDIDECSEEYLPYHAKWLGLEYDQNFTSDINRLILKTWQEAEPYKGTADGVAYLLQRIFKAKVKITVDKYVDVAIIDMYINSDSSWLLTHIGSIRKLIRSYLALRTKYELITNLNDSESLESVANAYDDFMDIVRELYNEVYDTEISEEDVSLKISSIINEEYNMLDISLTNDVTYLTNKTFYTFKQKQADTLQDTLISKFDENSTHKKIDKFVDLLKLLIIETYNVNISETFEENLGVVNDEEYIKSVEIQDDNLVTELNSEVKTKQSIYNIKDSIQVLPQLEISNTEIREEIGCNFIYNRLGLTNCEIGLTSGGMYTCDRYYKNQTI